MTNKFSVSGSTLKIVAIVTMLIDHTAYVFIEKYFSALGLYNTMTEAQYTQFLTDYSTLFLVDRIMRGIGRIAFPIFVFLLVQGFQHTRNKWKYALRLGLFALVSEIPFDLAFHDSVLEFSYQNVFFTLAIGVVMMITLEKIEEKINKTWLYYLISLLVSLSFAAIAIVLNTDYSGFGILAIAIMYLFRRDSTLGYIFACLILILTNLFELPAILGILLIKKYDGTRGLALKYVFYVFYPLHLLILYLISTFVL